MLRGSHDAVVRSSVRLLHELNIGSKRFPGRFFNVPVADVPKIRVALALVAISAHLHDRDRDRNRDRSADSHIVVVLITAAAPVHVGYRDRDRDQDGDRDGDKLAESTSYPAAGELSDPKSFNGGNLF